jgi:hypothetical protein
MQKRVELRASSRAKHDRLEPAVKHVVEGADERPAVHHHGQAAEPVSGQQVQALLARQLHYGPRVPNCCRRKSTGRSLALL